jgi:type I restriction enzyme S subunit
VSKSALIGGGCFPRLRELSNQADAFVDGPFGSNLKTEHYTTSGARVIRLQNIGRGVFLDQFKAFISLDRFDRLERHSVRPGDVIVAALGDGARPAGRACTVPPEFGKGIVKADCFRVRLPPDVIEPEYLIGFLNSPVALTQAASQMRGATRPRLTVEMLRETRIPLPGLAEQRRIAARLREELAAVTAARTAFEAQLAGLDALVWAILRETLAAPTTRTLAIRDCLREVTAGIGERWREFPVLGATRAGLAPAKEGVGKAPGRYKPVRPGTIFYNPMRILLGSIALLDDDDAPGITSPDYVAMTAVEGTLHPRWFYHWFRSRAGAEFIKSLTRGAVRERLLFNRLAQGEIPVPAWPAQVAAAAKFREIKRSRAAITARLAALEKMPAMLLRAAFVSPRAP